MLIIGHKVMRRWTVFKGRAGALSGLTFELQSQPAKRFRETGAAMSAQARAVQSNDQVATPRFSPGQSCNAGRGPKASLPSEGWRRNAHTHSGETFPARIQITDRFRGHGG
jgi:hypothetical protein